MIVLALFVLQPFIGAILTAIVISYISYPLYRLLHRATQKPTISALITTSVIILVITIPTLFAVTALSKEVLAGYIIAKQFLATGSSTIKCVGNPLCSFLDAIGINGPSLINFMSDSIGKAAATVYSKSTSYSLYTLTLPKIFANIFVSIFLTYYLLKDGQKLVRYAKSILPLKSANQELLLKRFNDVTYAVVYGNVVVAVLQGLLTVIGFLIFGVASPLIWGVVTMFTSMLPFLGAFVVWLPAAAFLIITGYSSSDSSMVLRGVGLLIYGFFFISTIDNILKPRIIGQRANLHPALVLLGVIGGLSTLGVIGIIIGPVTIALASTIIKMSSRRRETN